ncbi:hypothetical protein pdam_00011192, partial [Pocillopora damicornis]
MINLESLESPFVVPLMITCPNDNIQLVSTSIPNSIQENESFIINLEKLSNWKAWTLKGSRFRSYSVKNDGDGRVVALNKTGRKHTNIVVCWTPNVCMSCPNFTLEQRKVPNKIRGVTAASTVTLPSQAKNMKQKVGLTPGTAAKKGNDPLLAVLKLKKSTFPGFIREVVCNDLPTIMLYTDSQPEKIVKFCYHNLA